MSLISATWYARCPDELGWYARETRSFGNERVARMWAAQVVPSVVTTRANYWRDTARGEWVEFTRIAPRGPRSHGRWWRARFSPAGYYYAPVALVPSVGELGVTP